MIVVLVGQAITIDIFYVFSDTSKTVIIFEVKAPDTFYVRKVVDENSNFSSPEKTQWIMGLGNSFFEDTLRPPFLKVGIQYFLKIEVTEDTTSTNSVFSRVEKIKIKKIIYPPTLKISHNNNSPGGTAIINIQYTIGGCDSAVIEVTVSGDSVVYKGDTTVYSDSNIIDTIFFKIPDPKTFRFDVFIHTACGESNGMSFYSEVIPKANSITGIKEEKENKISVYPNPTVNFIFVPSGHFVILNTIGQTMISGVSTNGSVDVSILPQGIYIYKNEFGSARFIKK